MLSMIISLILSGMSSAVNTPPGPIANQTGPLTSAQIQAEPLISETYKGCVRGTTAYLTGEADDGQQISHDEKLNKTVTDGVEKICTHFMARYGNGRGFGSTVLTEQSGCRNSVTELQRQLNVKIWERAKKTALYCDGITNDPKQTVAAIQKTEP